MMYMGKWIRRSQVMTTAEWMHFRFGSGKQGDAARLISAIANIIFTIAMISIFAIGSPAAAELGNSVSLLVPQGWAVRGLMASMNGDPVSGLLINTLVLLVWSAAFFFIGVWRFNRRYA